MSDNKTRIDLCFATLRQSQRKAFVAYIMAGDPNRETAEKIMAGLPAAGADIIELGMPFSDPMADGVAIQNAAQRALANGHTMHDTLDMVRVFRQQNQTTPIVLMGYYNPIYFYGAEKFVADAHAAGVDGLIIVDLPPEEDEELCLPALKAGLNFIRLASPTSDDKRLPQILNNTSGFVYYISITGITGTGTPQQQAVAANVARIKQHTKLPIVVGFGIRTPEQAASLAPLGDGVVVGSVLVDAIAKTLNNSASETDAGIANTLKLVSTLAESINGL